MGIISLLNSNAFFCVNKSLIKALGSCEAAMFLSSLCSKHDYWEERGQLENGFFYCTQEYIEDELRISPKMQRKYCKSLEDMGILETMSKGLPKKKFYRINEKMLSQVIEMSKLVPTGTTVCDHRAQQDSPNGRINNNKETTPEEQDHKIHYTPNFQFGGHRRFYYSELDGVKFDLCIEAMKAVKKLKDMGAKNLYDGPLLMEEWEMAQSSLEDSCTDVGEVGDIIEDIYENRYSRSDAYSECNSINLCFMVHGYDENRCSDRVLRIASYI